MKKELLSLIALIILLGCNSKDNKPSGIFLGGQIVNPSSRNVTLYQGTNIIEMLELNSDLMFKRKYDSLSNGIYKLEHLPEYQTLLLEENDSIWVRINAAAFDESIVYSGV